MKHIEEQILWDYVTGDTDPKNIPTIVQHLSSCKNCNDSYKNIRTLHSQLLEFEDPDVPLLGFSQNVIDKIEEQRIIEKSSVFWVRFTKIALIIAIIIAVVLPFLMITSHKVELSVSMDVKNKLILPMASICLVLWILYVFDLMLKHRYTLK